MSMEIQSRDYHRVSVVRVVGRVDAAHAPSLNETMDGYVKAGRSHLVLELDGVNYISSAGLRVLVSTQKALKERGGYLALAQPSEKVMEALKLAGFEVLFQTFNNTEAAVGSV